MRGGVGVVAVMSLYTVQEGGREGRTEGRKSKKSSNELERGKELSLHAQARTRLEEGREAIMRAEKANRRG